MPPSARLIVLAACLIAGIPLAGAQTPRGVKVAIDASLSGGGKPRIDGRTNLPDGTALTVSLRPDDSACAIDCVPIEVDVRVANGGFQVGPFTRDGRPLPAGPYTLEITTGMARLQSVSVQSVIGPRGEYMFGKYVHPPEETSDENIVDYESDITIP
jgi:hypothetical protein